MSTDSPAPPKTGEDAPAADKLADKPADNTAESSLAAAQVDGAGPEGNGSAYIPKEDYKVEVKLSDMQADPDNPLYSAKTFEELKLYVPRPAGL
jgi:ATP-dependent RNA helicase DDX19/DBP5